MTLDEGHRLVQMLVENGITFHVRGIAFSVFDTLTIERARPGEAPFGVATLLDNLHPSIR